MKQTHPDSVLPGYIIRAVEPHCPTTLLTYKAWHEAKVLTLQHEHYLDMTEEDSSPADTIFLHVYPKTKPFTLKKKLGHQTYRGLSYPGNMVLLCRDTSARFGWDATAACVHIQISPSFVSQCISEIGQGDPERIRLHPVFNVHDPLVKHLGTALQSESDLYAGGLGGDAYATSLLHTLTLHLLLNYSPLVPLPSTPTIRTNGLTPNEVKTMRDFIAAHLDESLTVTRMADALQMTVIQFRRRFKHTLHLAPHQYVIRQRVERASQLLQSGRYNIAQVAHKVGFADQSHLHRHFKRLRGVNPADVLPTDQNIQRIDQNVQD